MGGTGFDQLQALGVDGLGQDGRRRRPARGVVGGCDLAHHLSADVLQLVLLDGLATPTPSPVTVGAPQPFSMATRWCSRSQVTLTVLARRFTPSKALALGLAAV